MKVQFNQIEGIYYQPKDYYKCIKCIFNTLPMSMCFKTCKEYNDAWLMISDHLEIFEL